MTRERFSDACRTASGWHQLILRYAEAFGIQTAETSRAGACVNLKTRLARWLLMAHDRIEGDVLAFTHAHLARMLSTRRPGITVALHVLEGEHLIRSKRAHILIGDRAGLKGAMTGTG